jgi:transitional endoplasmic reticulum ATPase
VSQTTWESFERYRQKGLDARRAGQNESAKVYLLEAARVMVQLSKEAGSEELRNARRELAGRLLELAKTSAQSSNSKFKIQNSKLGTAEGESSAEQWEVHDKPTARFTDIAGLDEVKEEIRLKMVYPVMHADLAEKFGIRAGGGVLLYGPPGTGKTMLARATAGELDAAFFRVSAADMLSKWVGEAEQNIRKLFDAARENPRSIVFIDEIDSLLPARRDDGGAGVMQRVVPQILQEIDGFERSKTSILFMGATNVPWNLDPAVMRPGRFDEKVYVPLPDLDARIAMLQMYLAHRPLAENVDLAALAGQLDGYSGADIKHFCDRAAVVPFMKAMAGDEAVITCEIIAQVISELRPSVSPDHLRKFEEWAR